MDAMRMDPRDAKNNVHPEMENLFLSLGKPGKLQNIIFVGQPSKDEGWPS